MDGRPRLLSTLMTQLGREVIGFAALHGLTAQAIRLRTSAAPDDKAVTSYVAEIDELGRTMAVAHRSIWSFEDDRTIDPASKRSTFWPRV